MSATRTCPCTHGYPLCACHEGLLGEALWRRANRLSSLAGWPGALDAAAVAAHLEAVQAGAPERARRSALYLEAERCPLRRIPECGCSGMECGPGGERPGQRVSLEDCAACPRTAARLAMG